MRTQVVVVGAGPAGLLLSHLLALVGVESVVLETRERATIEATIRAGLLEPGTVDLLVQCGLGNRLLREGAVHQGVLLRFAGQAHRVDLQALCGRSVTLYPQHEVLRDMVAARLGDGGDVRFGVSDVALHDLTGAAPRVTFTDADGTAVDLRCAVVAGCDGSGGVSRRSVPASERTDLVRAYPYGWYGILAEAPRSTEELVYAHSPRGFALVSTRTESVQRMYLQCAPDERVEDWSDDRIWAELRARVDGDGLALQEGRIFDRSVIPLRSYVREPMRYGRLVLAGDAAHTVPPTGAKGLNLAVADVRVLAQALEVLFATGRTDLLEAYSESVLRRVWRAQHFSWWMTSMLHTAADASGFDVRRQQAALELLVDSPAASRSFAEGYLGWPDGPA